VEASIFLNFDQSYHRARPKHIQPQLDSNTNDHTKIVRTIDRHTMRRDAIFIIFSLIYDT
jgi:hypothetical protein